MVTSTRRGPIDSTPRSTPVTRRSKRNLDAEETPTMPKKRRTATKSSDSKNNTRLESADPENIPAQEESTPVSAAPAHDDDGPASARQGSPKVVVPLSSPAKEISLESEIQASIIHTPSPPREEARSGYVVNSVARQIRVSPTPAKPKAAPGKKGKAKGSVNQERGTLVEDASDTVEESKPAEPKNTKIRFGSEEPMDTDKPEEAPAPAPPKPATNEDDYESDSDEAPEEVTTSAAAIKAKAAEAEAARAFEAQQEKLEQKRKERLNRVADEQRQKREKEEKRAAKHAKLEARAAKEAVKAPFKFDMNSLPSLLPTELLEAAGDKRPPTPPLIVSGPSAAERRKEKLARHIKFLEKGEKPIKDVKKGKLNVHVLDRDNTFLQPKVNAETKSIREKWLQGREDERMARSKGKFALQRSKVERRAVPKGFSRGDD